MGSENFYKLKADKASMIQKHRLLRKIANLFRYIEFCVVFILLTRFSFQLPIAVKNSSEYLRSFSISPCFVFLIGNIIIISLFAQSGHFSPPSYKRDNPEPDFYQEYLLIQEEQKKQVEKQSIETEHAEKQNLKTEDSKKSEGINKNVIKCAQKQSMKQIEKTEERIKRVEKQRRKSGDKNIGLEVRDYRRCESDTSILVKRCEREIKIEDCEKVGRNSYPEDGMSSDQFRCTIEAFIARQRRLRNHERCLALTL